jgi:site-specific DNA-methyltransferase (adenine-specific)/modification methylase
MMIISRWRMILRIEQIENCTLYCADNSEVFPLVERRFSIVTDPPYGIFKIATDMDFSKMTRPGGNGEVSAWDSVPSAWTFEQIKQFNEWIVWGGNYFAEWLGNCKAPLLWHKKTGKNAFADGELAWTSFTTGCLRIFEHQWCGVFKDSERGKVLIHPTQKPVRLMSWCLDKLTKPDGVFDPFMGSGSVAIACMEKGIPFIGVERDEKYFELTVQRAREYSQKQFLF